MLIWSNFWRSSYTWKIMMPHVTLWLSPFPLLLLFHHAIYNIFAIMSGSDLSTDPCIKKTLSLLKSHPMLKHPSGIYFAGFSEQECCNRALQMMVYHHLPFLKPKSTDNQGHLPLESAGAVSSTNINIMPMTTTEQSLHWQMKMLYLLLQPNYCHHQLWQ